MSADDSFGTVAIVGVGLLGGSVGKALNRNQSSRRIIGVGRSVDKLALALDLGAITEASASLQEAVSVSDIVILCTPVGQIIADVPLVLEFASPTAVITDVGSVKQAICCAAGRDSRFVGSHPMAGSERTGVVPSRSDLFQEATWAITPTEFANADAVQTVKRLAQSLGAATLFLTPEQHDHAVAVTSHLPHAIATSLMRMARRQSEDAPEIQRLTAGSFADATRVSASSPELWSDIFRCNSEALINVLANFRDEIDGFLSELQSGEAEKLYERFRSGADAKRSWSEQQ